MTLSDDKPHPGDRAMWIGENRENPEVRQLIRNLARRYPGLTPGGVDPVQVDAFWDLAHRYFDLDFTNGDTP